MSSPLGNGLLCILLSCYTLHAVCILPPQSLSTWPSRYHSLFIPSWKVQLQTFHSNNYLSKRACECKYAIEIDQRQRPLFRFLAFHFIVVAAFISRSAVLCGREPALVYYYRVCVIYHKNYAVTIALRCSNVYNHVRISPALLSFLLLFLHRPLNMPIDRLNGFRGEMCKIQ